MVIDTFPLLFLSTCGANLPSRLARFYLAYVAESGSLENVTERARKEAITMKINILQRGLKFLVARQPCPCEERQ